MSNSPQQQLPRSFNLLRYWFGMADPVARAPYILSGIALLLVKYAIEATVIWSYTQHLLSPSEFISPLLTVRAQLLETAPSWLMWALLIWTVPFVWIAVSMSIRRAADAGATPWLGLLVLVPFINLLLMIGLCALPSAQGERWQPKGNLKGGERHAAAAWIGIVVAQLVGVLMVLVSVYAFKKYAGGLFVGTPIMMGAASSYIYNRPHSRSYARSIGLAMLAIIAGFACLLLFAAEGVICIFMAAPLLLPLAALGGFIGKAIADATRRRFREFVAAIFVLPMISGLESWTARTQVYEITTVVEIDAPPEQVWQNVIDFPEITAQPEWFFQMGIACPQRARIEGAGIGAVRYCEFTTGTFVEPITVWDAPQRLAFDVVEQPDPMFELTPYRHIHPPHLDGGLRSHRGEFRLIRLSANRTRLEGRTWYEVDLFPQAYWTLWTDFLIHRIHARVLTHVKQISERS